MKNFIRALMALLVCFAPCRLQAAQNPTERVRGGDRIDLEKGWSVQSSAKVTETGAQISTSKFRPRGWFPTSIPTTVLSALVNNKVYADPYFGMNLRSIPGTDYPIGENFSGSPVAQDSPFGVSWWYRTEFKLAPSARGKTLWLNFDSINYRANVWLNGRQVAASDKVIGMYRMFAFDITPNALPGGVNTLAVEVFPPTPTDLSITFVDWNPMPPDKDMGLVRDVYLLATGPVAVRNTQVITKLDTPADTAPQTAHLSIATDLWNATDHTQQGKLQAEIGDIVLTRSVTIGPRASRRVEFMEADYPQLKLSHPKLWWPYPFGPQNLYRLHMQFQTGGILSDRQEVRFGIREVTSEIDAQQHRLFKINGRRILIRGGGWTSDMMLRFSPEREESEIRYVRDMHLNTIRLEGKMMNDHFFETCDRYGILVMAGWCCCSYWEQWRKWKSQDYVIAGESLRDQTRRLRNHPCLLAFLYGSDNSPDADAEAVYLKVLQEEHWPNPYVSSASERTTVGAGPTGVKMTGPYDYVAPNYWLLDHDHGGAFGFNTETSPGPAIPEMASLLDMLPKEHLWPIDEFWNFHAGGGAFANHKVFTDALEGRYGKATSLEDYVKKSQVMTYEGERAMFEAFGRNKYAATGVIQWMLNNAWPSTIWHLYDYYLRPGGGYFGTKKACELLHVQYSYDDRSVVAVNSFYRSFMGYQVTAEVYNTDLTRKFSKSAPVDLTPDSSQRIFDLPDIDGLSDVYFLRLSLRDDAGKEVSSNFYWLSTKQDVPDFAASDWRHTPIKSYADLTSLEKLPEAKVTVTSRTVRSGAEQIDHVMVENPTSHLAFFVHLRVMKRKDGKEVAPILWQDNYFELMPGEKREITATYGWKPIGPAGTYIAVDGWNLPPASKQAAATRAIQFSIDRGFSVRRTAGAKRP